MKMKIGDITEIIDGDRGKNYPKKSDFKDEGFCLFLNTGNVTSDGFVFKKNDFISEEKSNKLRKGKLERGDLVFTTRGTVGNVAYYSDNIPYDHVRINSGMVIFRVFEKKVFNKFLYQILKHKNSRIYIRQYCTGSAQPQLPIMNLRNIELNIPPLETQYKIARILLAYDDLIENNERQIKLLEEAAQRLYKEWFVDLHFPGYEDVEIVDGIPEGWTSGVLGDLAAFKRGKTITKAQVQDGYVPVVAGGLEPAYYHNKANTVAPVITVSGSGANAGYARLYNVNVFASDCSFADSDTTPYLFYVYCFIKDNKDSFNALQKGSAQPHVYAKDINALKALIPTNKLIEEFCRIVSQYFEKIKILQMQIQLSTEARDRLLPKLMSGEVEV